MGNLQTLDAVLSVAEITVTKSTIQEKDSILDPTLVSSFSVIDTERTLFTNLKQKADNHRLLINEKNLCVIIHPENLDDHIFKDTIKNQISVVIENMRYSQEFCDFLKEKTAKHGICTAEQLTNVLNNVVEKNFTPSLITRNAVFGVDRAEQGSFSIEFVKKNGLNYIKGLDNFANSNFQNAYIANVATTLLNSFLEVADTSSVAGLLIVNIDKIAKRDKLVLLIFFAFLVLTLITVPFIIWMIWHHHITMEKVNSISDSRRKSDIQEVPRNLGVEKKISNRYKLEDLGEGLNLS